MCFPDDANDIKPAAARYDVARDQWGNVIRVQIHFNEAIQRTRQLTATGVLAAYGAAIAYFAANNFKYFVIPFTGVDVHFSVPLVFLGWIFLILGLLLDRYYYLMLESAVGVAMKIENDFDFPVKLSNEISVSVSSRYAKFVISTFYTVGFLVGLAICFCIYFLTKVGSA